MAAMTTALTEYANNGNSITWTVAGHTVQKPRLVIQTRRVPSGNQVMAEVVYKTIYGTEDVDGNPIPQKISYETKVRYPMGYLAADLSAAQVVHRDVVAGDEFAAGITTFNWLKS